MTRIFSLLSLLIAFSASAQVYRTTDENGNVVFTDKPPHSNSEQITINPTNLRCLRRCFPAHDQSRSDHAKKEDSDGLIERRQ